QHLIKLVHERPADALAEADERDERRDNDDGGIPNSQAKAQRPPGAARGSDFCRRARKRRCEWHVGLHSGRHSLPKLLPSRAWISRLAAHTRARARYAVAPNRNRDRSC